MTTKSNKSKTTLRTLEQAQAILESEGITDLDWLGEGIADLDWLGNDTAREELLGCTLESHRSWLCSDSEDSLRSWARSVRDDQGGE